MGSGIKTDYNPDSTKIYSGVITCALSNGAIIIAGSSPGAQTYTLGTVS